MSANRQSVILEELVSAPARAALLLQVREKQRQALREIADLMRDRKAYRLDMLSEPDQLYCASLFLAVHPNWVDDLAPANVPELYAVIPAMLMADSTARERDQFDRYQNLWTLMRKACLKQAASGIAHELELSGIEL